MRKRGLCARRSKRYGRILFIGVLSPTNSANPAEQQVDGPSIPVNYVIRRLSGDSSISVEHRLHADFCPTGISIKVAV